MTSLLLTANGNTPINSIGFGREFSIAVSGTFGSGTVKAQYATAGPVAASLAVDDDTESPAFTLTAVDAGTAGNSLTFAIAAPAASQALSLTQSGLDFVLTPACDAGDAAEVSTAMTGSHNDITVTADTAGTIGNGYSFELLDPSENDATLLVSTTDYLKFTVSLATDAGGLITTTATQLIAVLNAYAPFAALMTATLKSGDNGSGVVTALAETDLTGGGDNAAITTTAAQAVALINASPLASRHFTAALKAAYDGEGLLEELAEASFTGGTAGTFVDFQGDNAISFTAAGELIGTNTGALSTININLAGATSPSLRVIVTELPLQ